MVLGAVADAASSRLREPNKHYGPGLGLEALSAAAVLPEPVLTSGLKLEESDIKKAAVDRHAVADDVSAHRENISVERRRARAYQALLLLAIGVRRSTAGKDCWCAGRTKRIRIWPQPPGQAWPCMASRLPPPNWLHMRRTRGFGTDGAAVALRGSAHKDAKPRINIQR